eukprot:CAMPEP_0119047546 /NCGR_PEP_ID=MMETSP1177-20130426/53721_1 /TAXON_ID=2985 /ORGANISM="Ochromonas sp, Strain CCMP1899" /LENGTH=336 /DNA_ID=CAMNT_0007022277 /DNA_START=354 /DNA_END=1364 /DNA_ORIENTATION=-
MICQRQRYIVHTIYDEDYIERIIAEVCAFAKKVNAKEFDIPQCFIAAIKRGRPCLDIGTTEEILSQVIIPSKEMPKECRECGEAIEERFPNGFQVRNYLVDGIDKLCCMILTGFCTKRGAGFARGKHSCDHCFDCPGFGTCIRGASMHCYKCGHHTHMGYYENITICHLCGADEGSEFAETDATLDSDELINSKKIMHFMDSVGKIPYIETILNSNRELYEQIFLYQLEKMDFPISSIDVSTLEEFKAFMQRDMRSMMGICMAKHQAQEGVIEKVQGGVAASIYDEGEELMNNLCRDGSEYVDKDEEVEDDDVDRDQEYDDDDGDDSDDNEWEETS